MALTFLDWCLGIGYFDMMDVPYIFLKYVLQVDIPQVKHEMPTSSLRQVGFAWDLYSLEKRFVLSKY